MNVTPIKFREEKLPSSPFLAGNAFARHYSFKFEVLGKKLRVFYKKHVLGDEVPLILFLHEFGGSLDVFREQLRYFGHTAHVLALDLVFHGQSDTFSPLSTYNSVTSILEDIYYVFQHHQARDNVIIAHGYGCSLATKLYPRIQDRIRAMVFIGASGKQPPLWREVNWLVSIPTRLLRAKCYARHWQKVRSIYGNRFLNNRKKRTAIGSTQTSHQITPTNSNQAKFLKYLLKRMSWATEEDFQRIASPLLLLTGEKDRIAPSGDLQQIVEWCGSHCQKPQIIPRCGHYVMFEKDLIVNAVINKFLIEDVGLIELDPKRQLFRSKGAQDFKWSMKNFAKWSDTSCVGELVRGTLFRPMKIMRQTDVNHSPKECHRRHPRLGLVMDVSSAEPPYDVSDPALKDYYKLPTESKSVPSVECCHSFIKIADAFWKERGDYEIGVHCHYGFNRTGFLICSYLIEKCGVSVKEALKRFAEARPPGIKHQHFRDELALRYAECT